MRTEAGKKEPSSENVAGTRYYKSVKKEHRSACFEYSAQHHKKHEEISGTDGKCSLETSDRKERRFRCGVNA